MINPPRSWQGTTLVLLLLWLLASGPATASEPIVLTGPAWPPMLYMEEPRKGLAVEIVIAAFNASDRSVEIRINPWRRVLWLARSQQVDGLVGIWHADAREEFLLFSQPYYQSHIAAAYHREKLEEPRSIADLDGLRVGTRQGGHYGGIFNGNDRIQRHTASTDLNMLHMVAAGRLDVAVGDRLILQNLIDQSPHLSERVRLSEVDLLVVPIHFASIRANENATELVDAFNRGLERIRESGELEAIVQRFRQ
ncbi:MAG: transporter substrate-binding domain-containing protein [Oleiphilaceae bacterium]|nr:transporter substrate-binding domain-containing protein [Oleiphilaceae bacterium]